MFFTLTIVISLTAAYAAADHSHDGLLGVRVAGRDAPEAVARGGSCSEPQTVRAHRPLLVVSRHPSLAQRRFSGAGRFKRLKSDYSAFTLMRV